MIIMVDDHLTGIRRSLSVWMMVIAIDGFEKVLSDIVVLNGILMVCDRVEKTHFDHDI